MTEKYETIDYSETIGSLKEDLETGYINEDSTLYIIRQKTAVYVEKAGIDIFPVVDYFYDRPVLMEEVKFMTVLQAKKDVFEALEAFGKDDGKEESAALKEALEVLAEDLKDYTAGNKKRNERTCGVVSEEGGCPVMIYFDDTDVAEKLQKISVKELIKELEECS